MADETLAHENLRRIEARRATAHRGLRRAAAALLALAGLWPLATGGAPHAWALVAAAALLLGDLVLRVATPLLLALLFYGVVTPFGLAWRAVRRDPLRLRRAAGARTYWIERDPPGPAPDTMKDPF